jgi:diacylglycerol kinase (ATP)
VTDVMADEMVTGAVGAYARRTFIILNPAAGQEHTARLRRRIGGAFAIRSAPFDLVETSHAGHASELAREASNLGYRAVCAVGGDGTFAEVANGLSGTQTPFGLIPRGTANQFAKNMRLPVNLEAAVEVVVNGKPTPIDLGNANGRAFTLVAGAGFDAAVMATATRSLKERLGFGAYIYAAMKESFGYKPALFHIVADGREMDVSAVSVMLANAGELIASYLPLRLSLSPNPLLAWQDGLLDILIVAPEGITGIAAIAWHVTSRRFSGAPPLLHLQAREITIESDPVVPLQIDGDVAGRTPVAARAVPHGALILTPP